MSALQKFKTFFSKNVLLCLTVPMVVFSLLVPQPFVWMGRNISIDLSGIPFLKENFPSFGFVNMLLCVIMFGMGMTLRWEDFSHVFLRPRDIVLGLAAQFGCMPLLAFLLCRLFRLPPDLAMGVILVGAAPGGTASNVLTFIARGDVPYSVALTAVATFLSLGLMPLLTWLLGGVWVPGDVWGLFLSIVNIVLLPVLLGILCAIWRAAAAKRKEYLKREARDTLTVHYQKEGNREP